MRTLTQILEDKSSLRAKAKRVLPELQGLRAKLEAGEALTAGEQVRLKNLSTAVAKIGEEDVALDVEAGEVIAEGSRDGTLHLESGDGNVDPEASATGAAGGRGSLYAAVMKAGFDRRRQPRVTVPFNAATFDGNYADAQHARRESPGLGADQRYLYPSLQIEPVGRDVTGVDSFRQKSRDPATPADMIRAIDAVTAKPETGTETELVQEALKQIASVESGVPNVMLESARFRQWIEFDLRFAYSDAIDFHVIAQIVAAGPPLGTEAPNLLEATVHAAEEVASNGYSPRILVASPEDLIALLLLVEPVSGDYVGSKMDRILNGLTKVAVKGLTQPFVIDPTALGTLYVSNPDLAAFEENAGKTNSSTVRFESNGLYLVQRGDAAAAVIVAEEVSE